MLFCSILFFSIINKKCDAVLSSFGGSGRASGGLNEVLLRSPTGDELDGIIDVD